MKSIGIRTYPIGRSAGCAIHLDHQSVSRLHAELTVTEDGRLFVVDRVSTEGTFRLADGRWQPLRQDFVDANDSLRFGESECRAGDLLRRIQAPSADTQQSESAAVPPKGPLRRDPNTGEVVSR